MVYPKKFELFWAWLLKKREARWRFEIFGESGALDSEHRPRATRAVLGRGLRLAAVIMYTDLQIGP